MECSPFNSSVNFSVSVMDPVQPSDLTDTEVAKQLQLKLSQANLKLQVALRKLQVLQLRTSSFLN